VGKLPPFAIALEAQPGTARNPREQASLTWAIVPLPFQPASFQVIEKTFDEWLPRAYLNEYYRDLTADELQVIRYLVDEITNAPAGPVLCFGAGPTLHHVFALAPYASEIYLADYLPENLAEIERWRRDEPGAHDWSAFARYTLECERPGSATPEAVASRMSLTRQRIARLEHCDAGLVDPLGPSYRGFFATVLSPFCADSITDDKQVWARYSRNIASLVRPQGLLLTIALRCCRRYKVGPRYFPSADVDENDLQRVLAADCDPDTVRVQARDVPEHAAQGYTGILLARALRSAVPAR
jgi:hypothetical protein